MNFRHNLEESSQLLYTNLAVIAVTDQLDYLGLWIDSVARSTGTKIINGYNLNVFSSKHLLSKLFQENIHIQTALAVQQRNFRVLLDALLPFR